MANRSTNYQSPRDSSSLSPGVRASVSKHPCSFLFLLLVTILFVPSANAAKSPTRPNIVRFLTDDQSQLDCSPYGSTLRTPNIQRLANNGLTFTRAFVASPSCAQAARLY
jgi:hypothetical protein